MDNQKPQETNPERSPALAATAGSARGGHSGLRVSTLRKYAKSELLERGEGGVDPIYMHHGKCPSYCDFACNGQRGFDIATDINELQLYTPNDQDQP